MSAVVQQCGLMRGSWSCCCIWTVFGGTNCLAELSQLDYLYHRPLCPYKDRFGIHINAQTVVIYLDIGACTTRLRMYLLRIMHTLRRYNNSSGRQYDTRTQNVNSGATDWSTQDSSKYILQNRSMLHDLGRIVSSHARSCVEDMTTRWLGLHLQPTVVRVQ